MPPAYARLHVDERRRQLLELGTRLFTEHSYDELSMAKIAKAAGISKALLYHYFPSKQAYFVATLQAAASELELAVNADDERPPAEQLERGLDAFLAWIDANRVAYAKLMRSIHFAEEVKAVVDAVREDTANRIIAGLTGDQETPPPALRAAVRAWLWFMDGACLDWIEHDDLDRDRLKGLLLGTLIGAITAAGEGERLARLAPA